MTTQAKFFILLALLLSLELSCTKENRNTKELPQILIGEWELIEAVSLSSYQDTLWHKIINPELSRVNFSADSTVIFIQNNFEEIGTYYVQRNESINFRVLWNFRWDVISFEEERLTVSLGFNLEGEDKRRYAKVD